MPLFTLSLSSPFTPASPVYLLLPLLILLPRFPVLPLLYLFFPPHYTPVPASHSRAGLFPLDLLPCPLRIFCLVPGPVPVAGPAPAPAPASRHASPSSTSAYPPSRCCSDAALGPPAPARPRPPRPRRLGRGRGRAGGE
ncbi:hypothetical protein F5Y15DRAFT_367765 [Xylariaceae sp. FL0016]|nr:hypothetical protein F5Y15DRAFT_367765 [Xylariaceae sp. FL0016]